MPVVLSAAILLVVVMAAFLLITGLFQTSREMNDPIEQRLNRLAIRQTLFEVMESERQKEQAAREEEERHSAKRRDLLPTLTRLLSTQFWYERLQADLIAARSPWKANEIILASVLMYLLVGMLGALIFGNWVGFVLAIPALALPWFLVRVYSNRFLRRFELQLADTLTMMANALRAGYSYLQTVEMIARESMPPIGDEFKVMMQEMNVGIDPNQALVNFADRMKSSDVELMVTAVLVQRRVGGTLSEILDTIAEVIRDRVRLRGLVRTLTAQGRITGMLLGSLPIFVGIALYLLTNPSVQYYVTGAPPAPTDVPYLEPLFNTTAGWYMLGVAAIMQISGFLAIKKITSIEV